MDKIEQSFFKGFIKASNFGSLGPEALKALESALPNAGKEVGHIHPPAGMVPPSLGGKHIADQMELPLNMPPQQQSFLHTLLNEQPHTTDWKNPTGGGSTHSLMDKFNQPNPDMPFGLSGAKATAGAASVGAGAVGAGYGGQFAGKMSVPDPTMLKDPLKADIARKELANQQHSIIPPNLFHTLLEHVQKHKGAYGVGAGAAGLGGLAYAMHQNSKKRPSQDLAETGEDQPGGDPNISTDVFA